MKRIAILGARGIPARYGGFETFAEEISSRLASEGFAVTVFCEATSNVRPNKYRGVDLRYVAAPRLGPLSTIAYDLFCLWACRRTYDVVYMLGYGASVFCFLPRLWGAEAWINMDGLEWRRGKWGLIARSYLHVMESVATWMPNRMIADARSIRVDLRSRYGTRIPCDVIPYGCNLIGEAPGVEAVELKGLTPGSYYLVVCRFEPENHVEEIITGFVSSNSEHSLILVGDHKARTSYVERLLVQKDKRVRFVGPIYDSQELISLRYYCRAYVHGHSVGGTNPSLLEAMGCSNLIVAHDNPFNREVLDDSGLYFDSPLSLSRILTEIECERIQRDSLRKRAQARASKYYSWSLITSTYKARLSSAGDGSEDEVDVAPHGHAENYKSVPESDTQDENLLDSA